MDGEFDVAGCLNELGLSQYVESFVEHGVDGKSFPHLTSEDLREIGVKAVGHRRLVLEAIKELAQRPAQTVETDLGGPTRRQLTILFADLVGSVSISAQLDPEEMRTVLASYHTEVSNAVRQHGGHVAQFLGDGHLAYFGWPVAHENSAQRAVSAGLSVVAAIARLHTPTGAALSCRVGIATGLVVVGELIGERAAKVDAVVGDTPNLAARLQAMADPGAVVVSDATRKLLGDAFEVETIGARRIKGLDRPETVHRIVTERPSETRFDAFHGSNLGPIFGRESELASLKIMWEAAKTGKGQCALISGEAGLGKSRIVRAISDGIADDDAIRLSYQCSPNHIGTAFYPMIQQLTKASGISAADSVTGSIDKLQRLTALAGGGQEDATRLFAELLNLDTKEVFGPLDIPPPQLRERTLQAFIDQLIGLSKDRPVLAVLEDVHWIDPTTQELFDRALDQIADAKVLVLITARPEYDHRFNENPIVRWILLNRLVSSDIHSIVRDCKGAGSLEPEVLERIAERSDGIPLYAEELTKSVLESRDEHSVGDNLGAVPASLHDSLISRLDRMNQVKAIAQIAACIGREFEYSLLGSIAPCNEDVLLASLDQLVDAGLVFHRGGTHSPVYSFKHALLRDAAYESLLLSKRQELHAAILRASERADAPPEVLARHAREAKLIPEAIDHFERAGDLALSRPAYKEGISNLEQALELLGSEPASPEQTLRRLDLQVKCALAYMGGYGHGAEATVNQFDRARSLVEEVGETQHWLTVFYGNWVGHFTQSHQREALRLARDALDRAQRQEDPVAKILCYRLAATSEFITGNPAKSHEHVFAGLPYYEQKKHSGLATKLGQEPGMTLQCYAALTHLLLGNPEQAREHGLIAVRLGAESGHPLSHGYSLTHAMFVGHMLGDAAWTEELVRENVELSLKMGLTMWEAYSRTFESSVWNFKGDYEQALAAFENGKALLDRGKAKLYLPYLTSVKLEALIELGRFDEFDRTVREIDAQFEASAERWVEPEIRRLEGIAALRRGDRALADSKLRVAILKAGEQRSVMFLKRAEASLSQLGSN